MASPYDSLIREAVNTLRNGGVLLYPTDTIWGIGCDATNEAAVKRVFEIKERATSKSLIVLVDTANKIDRYFDSVPDAAWDIIDYANRPTTLILDDAKHFAPSVIAEDGSAGVRVCQEKTIQQIIRHFKKPIVSTSANISGEPSPKEFNTISTRIKDSVDFIFDHPDFYSPKTRSSSIVKIARNSEVTIIRE